MRDKLTTRASLRGLYAITPSGLDETRLITNAEAALRGGTRIVQFRDKTRDSALQHHLALTLRALTRRFNALLIINDNLPLALSSDADGVHLGGTDGDLAKARRQLGPNKILGASCYADFEQARAAVQAGADYIAFGAVFASPTKPHAVRADLSLFERSRRELAIPTCAIGGITERNAPSVVASGADMLAVITDLFEAPNIEERARAFQLLFPGEPD